MGWCSPLDSEQPGKGAGGYLNGSESRIEAAGANDELPTRSDLKNGTVRQGIRHARPRRADSPIVTTGAADGRTTGEEGIFASRGGLDWNIMRGVGV